MVMSCDFWRTHIFWLCKLKEGIFIERESAVIKDEKRLNVNLAFILKWPPSHWQDSNSYQPPSLSLPLPSLSFPQL